MLKFCYSVVSAVKEPLFCDVQKGRFNKVQVAGAKFFYPKEPVDDSEWPEQRKLRVMERQPNYGAVKPPKMPKMLRLLRGPEPIHTELLYKGYGVKALLGGRLKSQHFDTIRNIVNKKLNVKRMFALWRVDAPWQPVSKRGPGKRMGGGKGAIHHYITPVKADRIIIELGGDLEEAEAMPILTAVANILPFPARVVSQKDLEKEKEYEEWLNKNNLNKYSMEYAIMNNLGGCQRFISKNDFLYFGRYK